jgi:thioredoxin-like negative regulator of GroEL
MIQDKHLQNLQEIADNTARTPKERDLARILGMAEILLAREKFESAQNILKIYLEEFEKIVAC